MDKPFNPDAGISEWRNLGEIEYLLVLGFLAVFVFLYWAFRKSISIWYLIIGLLWFIGNLSPTLVLPAYVYPHTSAFPAIGIILAFMVGVRHFVLSCLPMLPSRWPILDLNILAYRDG